MRRALLQSFGIGGLSCRGNNRRRRLCASPALKSLLLSAVLAALGVTIADAQEFYNPQEFGRLPLLVPPPPPQSGEFERLPSVAPPPQSQSEETRTGAMDSKASAAAAANPPGVEAQSWSPFPLGGTLADFLAECYDPPSCKQPGDITFKPGLRLQPRYMYDNFNDDNDFFIRRFRIKSSGNIYGIADYGGELKVDSSERFFVVTPPAIVENAWLDFTVLEDAAYLKVGLYDVPFSRNALTSDSKLLFMDRTLIFDALARVGMADNTVGLSLHGRPLDGKLEYAFGVFDNIQFDRAARNSNDMMTAGRLGWYFLDPAVGGPTTELSNGWGDYRESRLGRGQRLALAVNFATLPKVHQGPSDFNLYAWGTDLFFNSGPWVVQAEYDWFTENGFAGTPDLIAHGWYVQAGYIFNCCWELAARYQNLDDPINPIDASRRIEWTSIGVNYYIHEHNLKVQMDYTWKNEQGIELNNNVAEVQMQLDF